MDLRFTTAPTPIGTALAVASEDGLLALRFVDGEHEPELERIMAAARLSAARDDDALTPVVAQLAEYFEGERRSFDIPLDLRLVKGFTRAALEAVCEIPYGETAGYGEVAIAAGVERAARAAGTACATTPISVIVPVHRVVRADGTPGEYGGRSEVKRFLLDLESHAVAQALGVHAAAAVAS